MHEFGKIPPAPVGPPPPAPRNFHKLPPGSPIVKNGLPKNSIRHDSSVSSDSISQNSSPSYTTKTMEIPLLPPRTPVKNSLVKPAQLEEDPNSNAALTKSASTPASLQTIVRFHNGSSMSLHHRVSQK